MTKEPEQDTTPDHGDSDTIRHRAGDRPRRRRRRGHTPEERPDRAFVYSRDTNPEKAGWKARPDKGRTAERSNRLFIRLTVPVLVGLLIWWAFHYGRRSATPPPATNAVSVSQPVALDTTQEPGPPASPKPERGKAMEKVEEALRLREQGKLDDAFLLLREAKDIDPRLPGILLLQARIALAQRDLGQTDTLLLKSIRNGEEVVECLNLRGTLLATQKAFREAYACFEDAASTEPLNAYVYFYWGEALRQEGRSAMGTEKLRLAERLAIEQSDIFVIRAKLLLSQLESDDPSGAFAKEVQKRSSEAAAPGEWLLVAAGLALKEDRNTEAAEVLTTAMQSLQPVFYRYLIADPFFGFYRSRPAVKSLLSVQPPKVSEVVPPPTKPASKSPSEG